MKRLLSRLGVLEWSALIVLTTFAIAALIPGIIAPFDPLRTGVGRPMLPPGGTYFFGTDELGRDVFSRVVWGSRISMSISIGATLMALAVGSILGAIMAVRRDVFGLGVTLLINLVLVFPGVILAIALATLLVPSALTTVIVLGVLYTPPISRLVSATIQAEYGKPYVASLQVLGAGDLFILLRAVGRATVAVVLTFILVLLADAVLLEAALSFIAIGVQPPTPSWGNIVGGGRTLLASGRWWVATFSGVSIVLFALSINLLGDAFGNRHKRVRRARSTPLPAAAKGADGQTSKDDDAILSVEALTVKIPGHYGDVPVVDGVSLQVRRGEVLALVGESGSGKTLIAQAILGLLPRGAEATGSVRFQGRELLGASDRQLRSIRGRHLAFLPQDAIAALNPVQTIATQMALVTDGADSPRPSELLERVRLPAKQMLSAYPHELSGGQCQRIALAISLARRPELLVADEPTTALDVSVQAEIFQLISDLRREMAFSMLLISHDLALVATAADRIAVAYGGRIVESGTAAETLTRPRHRYTRGLLNSIHSMERRDAALFHIPGTVPNPVNFAPGCRFAGRCPAEVAQCATVRPPVTRAGSAEFA